MIRFPLMGTVLISMAACGSTGSNAITASSYEAQQIECVNKSSTRQQAVDCMCAIRKQYGQVCPAGADGGVQ